MSYESEGVSHAKLLYQALPEYEFELSWYAITTTGLKRETNQDSYICAPPVFAVADGMGGHLGGEIASQAIATRLSELGGNKPIATADITAALKLAVKDMQQLARENAETAGSTVTGIAIDVFEDKPVWNVFNIGDSRVYQYFDGALLQITTDHSIVQHLIDTGAITAAEAEIHPHANVITRAVGSHDSVIPDTVQLALIAGQRIIICSDGLTKELTDLGIQHFVSEAESAQQAAEVLIEQALDNAGRDNISVIVVDVHAVTQP